jgi:sirohydrochlorin ferrochelatase
LAEPGALSREVAMAAEVGLVYPLFMAGGWFTRTHLPEKLAEAGGTGWRVLPPFGLDEAVQALAVTVLREALAEAGQRADQTQVLLAAHGSFRSPAPAEVAYAVAARVERALGLKGVAVGFIDQSPRIVEVAAALSDEAIVLPFFAARGGHVIDDLPAALAEAGFAGRVLPPLGLDARVPGIIRRSLRMALV